MAAHAVQWLINVCLATVSSMPGGVGCLFGGGGAAFVLVVCQAKNCAETSLEHLPSSLC
jgi:hypothetical protein